MKQDSENSGGRNDATPTMTDSFVLKLSVVTSENDIQKSPVPDFRWLRSENADVFSSDRWLPNRRNAEFSMKTTFYNRFSRQLLVGTISLHLLCGWAVAQGFSGRGFGGRGNRGLLRELQNESVRAELKITAEQQAKLNALAESQRNNRDQFSDIFQHYAAAKSEEERTQVRAEMQARFVELRKAADDNAKAILEPDQAVRLEQLHLHHEGPGIFVWDADLAKEFGITEDQKKELAGLGEQRMMARFALGREPSAEARQKLDDEWSARTLGILTPDQQKKWNDRAGPPPVVTIVADNDKPASPAAEKTTSAPREEPVAPPKAATAAPSTTTEMTPPAENAPSTDASKPAPPAAGSTAASASGTDVPATATPSSATAPVISPTTAISTPKETPALVKEASPAESHTVTLQPAMQTPPSVATFDSSSEKPAVTPLVAEPSNNTAEPAINSGKSGKEKKFSFNFRYAPWGDVLKLFAEEAGLSLDLNALPPGTFNYYDRNAYTPTEALDILNGYLLPKGYCLLRRDDFLVCVNLDDPLPPNLIPNVSADDLEHRGKNEMLTVIFPLEGVDVTQVATEVNEIKGPQGKVVGLKSTNSILVTDIGSNLLRIRDLLHDVTARGGPNDITFKAYQVKHIDVIDAEQIVRTLLGVTPRVANVSAATESRSERGMRGFGDRGDRGDRRSMPPTPPATSQPDQSPVRVATDTRTNQLLVTATLAQHLLVEQTLKTIDIDGEAGQFTPSSNRPFLKVYQVTSADAREVAKTIEAIIPGVVVNEDARNGKIHIQATPDQQRQVESLIAQMDGMGGSRQMAVIPLSRLDPVSVTTTLRSMFVKDGDAAPIIEADYYGQQLMVRANADQLAQIRTLLSQLGEDGTSRKSMLGESTARTIPLSGRDPAEILPLIERMWKANQGSTIRVISPPGTDRQQRPETMRTEPRERSDSLPPQTRIQIPAPTPVWKVSPRKSHPLGVRTVSQGTPATTEQTPPPPSSDNPTAPAKTPSVEKKDIDKLLDEYLDGPASSSASQPAPKSSLKEPADINIVVRGDEIFVTSSDPEQLNRFEEMLAQTMQAIPPRVTWTVYTLRVADATEAANMLKLLFPGSSVSAASSSSGGMMDTLSSGVSSLGSSLRDITGLGGAGTSQTLRIIPDTRQNALFVTGPAAQVREVEEMLKVLDATDLGGDSLRDKTARLIPVQYANVDEVFTMVKDVYKNYIDPPRVQENNNPFAMLARGGQGGGRGNEAAAPAPKLTVGVDKNTSHIIVWADDALFHEVEALVESVDQAAMEARRTVRVMNLENTNSVVVQGALGSLMPQVKVSVTGSRQTPGTTSSSSPTPTPSSSNTSDSGSDQMRQFFEQRMRDRMRGGGGDWGSRGFGRGGFGGFGGGGPGGGFRGFGGGGSRGSRGQ